MMNKILQCENVGKKYPNFELRNVSFQVEQGYLTGLIGVNGAGKSTLIRILSGEDTDFVGNVTVGGLDLRGNPAKAREMIGVVSDSREFFWDMSAIDNGRFLGRLYKGFDEKRYRMWLLNMDLPMEQPIGQFSKGMKRKFQISFAMAYEPAFLLMDEPTDGFDPVFRRDFRKILQDLLELGVGILMSTHILGDLEKIADYVVVLDKGEQKMWEEKEVLLKPEGRKRIEELTVEKLHVKDLLREYGGVRG